MSAAAVAPSNNAEPKVVDLDAEAAAAATTPTQPLDDETEGSPSGGRLKQNRLEKKSRKALARLGLKPVPGVVKITIKKSKHLLFSIMNPDVFKSPSSDTYVIFGDAKIDDAATAAHAKAAEAFRVPEPAAPAAAAAPPAAAEESEDVDATGVSEKDIELVMTQGSCSRARAIKALKENNNDIVEAIMSVSS